jgi:hypothetical protein
MLKDEEKPSATNDIVSVRNESASACENVRRADDVLLAKLGYKSEFKREFSVSRIALRKATGC